MSDTVIRVENLGKKYILGHQREERYTTLRDSIANSAKGLLKSFQRSKSSGADPSSEEFWALKDVSFEIKQGDRVGIIGRNGAGKSTLLKILSRITEPTSGSIRIKGRVASLLEVGTGFHPELTGRENISLNGAILGMSKAEIVRKFDEIVAFAEVEKFLDTPVKRYSSGMYVRLAFSVAAHLEPEILIVDEVLAVGDAQFQKKCLGKMEDVGKEGRTVIFVSHNMGVITQLCNKGIYLTQGSVSSQGNINEVVTQYVCAGSIDNGIVEFSRKRSNPPFAFNRIVVADRNQLASGEIDIRYPFDIHLDYEINQQLKNVELSIRISTSDGRPVLTSSQSDCSPDKVTSRMPGLYRSTISIPDMFLVPGSYMLTVAAHEPSVQMFDLYENAISFRVLETGTKLAKYNNIQSMGVILKDFDWFEVERQNTEQMIA
jgi:lipopolysaccharide transport system ATP-binding protein